jgi:hypothetical protein
MVGHNYVTFPDGVVLVLPNLSEFLPRRLSEIPRFAFLLREGYAPDKNRSFPAIDLHVRTFPDSGLSSDKLGYRNAVVDVHFGEFHAAALIVVPKTGLPTERWPSARERPAYSQEKEMNRERPGMIPSCVMLELSTGILYLDS